MEGKKRPVMPAEGDHLLPLPLTFKKKKKKTAKERGEKEHFLLNEAKRLEFN